MSAIFGSYFGWEKGNLPKVAQKFVQFSWYFEVITVLPAILIVFLFQNSGNIVPKKTAKSNGAVWWKMCFSWAQSALSLRARPLLLRLGGCCCAGIFDGLSIFTSRRRRRERALTSRAHRKKVVMRMFSSGFRAPKNDRDHIPYPASYPVPCCGQEKLRQPEIWDNSRGLRAIFRNFVWFFLNAKH